MGITEKIETIRRQPEHIKMRYVWGAVAISMFFIFIIWMLSVTVLFKKGNDFNANNEGAPDLSQQLEQIKQSAPSLRDLSNQPLMIQSEGVQQNSTDRNSVSSNSSN